MDELIEHFCARDDLSTFDPYDLWKTRLGFKIKRLYHRRRMLGFAPAAAMVLFDNFINNRWRLFYTPQEYPIVRALAAMSLLNVYRRTGRPGCLDFARRHLEWLERNRCPGYDSYCWGLGFDYAVTADITYDRRTPLSTVTPYALEAFILYSHTVGGAPFRHVITGVYDFFERDIQVMEDDGYVLATSYGPFRDRIVTNAVSYAMYSYALLQAYLQGEQLRRAEVKTERLYRYVQRAQRPGGSWFYSPQGRSFIDCFHSCIVLKNLIKAGRLAPLPGCEECAAKGYRYLINNFFDPERCLFRRFTIRNKPCIVRFDLYDNAEVLNLAVLQCNRPYATALRASVLNTFCDGFDVYSQIDILGIRRNRNTLRWAVMPFLYALSSMPAEDPAAAGRIVDYVRNPGKCQSAV